MFDKRKFYSISNGLSFAKVVTIFSFIFWVMLFACVGVFEAKTWIEAYLFIAKYLVIVVAVVVIWLIMDIVTDWLTDKAHANHR
jgi:hypothetical protein